MRSPSMSGPGSGTGAEAVVAHLEDPHLARGAETVLDGGQHAQGVVTVAVEGEHGVDQVLDGPRARPGRRPSSRGRPRGRAHRSTWPGGSGRSTQARACATLPAGCASAGSDTDWSESTTDESGPLGLGRRLDRLDVGALESASRWAGTRPSRAARPLTWVSDSSAEASSTSDPPAASEQSTWKRSVDLPMPGGRRAA